MDTSAWVQKDASDEIQLLSTAAQGRCIFTFNIRDFTVLSRLHLQHRGIVVAAQKSWPLAGLIAALDRFLSESDSSEVEGRLVWLNSWR